MCKTCRGQKLIGRLTVLTLMHIIFLMPTMAFAYGEAIAVSPSAGLPGQQVSVIGTGWQDHASRGISVPIWIGFANEVARGQPDASGKFVATLTIPPSSPIGDLQISAIIGNGGSADTNYKIVTSQSGSQPIYWSEKGGHEGGSPQGKAPNLIVLVHGCCTTYEGYEGITEWNKLANEIYYEIVERQVNTSWEIVVWDWTKYTPPANPFAAIGDADGRGHALATAILNTKNSYTYIHLVGHSAGARLIDRTAKDLIDPNINKKIGTVQPFIYLTFLDAFTPAYQGRDSYGDLGVYPGAKHYAEHYVDKTFGTTPYTDAILSHAFNFDVTNWPADNSYQKRDSGHQWPRYWYEDSVTSQGPYGYPSSFKGIKYGYPLSFEGGYSGYSNLSTRFPPGQQCSIARIGDNCGTGGGGSAW